MAKITLTVQEIEAAVEQYYRDYKPEIAKEFDFSRIYFKLKGQDQEDEDVEAVIKSKDEDER